MGLVELSARSVPLAIGGNRSSELELRAALPSTLIFVADMGLTCFAKTWFTCHVDIIFSKFSQAGIL